MIYLSKRYFTFSLFFCISLVSPELIYTHSHYTSLFELPTSATVYTPTTVIALQSLVKLAHATRKKICLVGADKSQGGQTCSIDPSTLRINMQKLNSLIKLDVSNKLVTVQAGMTWRQLQEHIAPHRLAIKAMQSYHDFSIGGSLSVNIHGQDFHNAPLIKTVKSFTLLLPDGKIITVSRTNHSELFKLALGGYGLFGIIINVTLYLTDDVILERKVKTVATKNLAKHVFNHIKPNPEIAFYSARFSIGSSDLLEKALVITYEKTNISDTHLFKLTPRAYSSLLRYLLRLGHTIPSANNLRFFIENAYVKQQELISRNNFTYISITTLPQETKSSLYILQEYFIPYEHVYTFTTFLRNLVRQYTIPLLNVTARHVPSDTESFLAYAPQEACALVLYVHVPKTKSAYTTTVTWTRKLIDKALELKGTYYLPYQLIATQKQLETAYPRFKHFVELKKLYDPQELFTNCLYQQYT